MLKEFRPSIYFLLKFLGVYFLGNVAYGLFVESFSSGPDFITVHVARQVSSLLNITGESVTVTASHLRPIALLIHDQKSVLNVYEGCNGINVMVVFVAFLIAYGGRWKNIVWFLPLGIVTIHLFNLLRIFGLYVVALNYQEYFYYIHKYIFTAFIYFIVFVLWIIWIFKLNVRPAKISTKDN